MLGSQLVISALRRRGVRVIFSLSGNQIMPLYDACIDAHIRIVHVRHEAAAVFMADAWSQVTGEIGVAMLTAGPGITNGIAPLYSASLAESPVLLISGDSPVAEDGMGAFQELDQVSITKPLTKLSRRPVSMRELASSVDEAISTALAPRRGPVHLAIPFDLLTEESGISDLPEFADKSLEAAYPLEAVQLAATLFAVSLRPVVLGGPTSARNHFRTLWSDVCTRLQAPLVPLESPRGLKDPSIGRFAELLSESDLIVLAGKSLDFTLSFGGERTLGKKRHVLVLDPDPRVLARARVLLGQRLALAVECEPVAFLRSVTEAREMPKRTQWFSEVSKNLTARDFPVSMARNSESISSRELCEQIQQHLEKVTKPILICDGGEFGQWAQAFCRAPTRIINGMSGAIGGGICYAIAAKIASPESTVVALMGDGTSGFHFMEFDTAVREKVEITVVVGNDLRWNAEHLIQLREYGSERLVGCELADTARYHDAAAAIGAFGIAVQQVDQIISVLHAAAKSQLPACINVAIEGQAAPVFPTAVGIDSSH